MTNIVEQAARRLEELRRAGITVPSSESRVEGPSAGAAREAREPAPGTSDLGSRAAAFRRSTPQSRPIQDAPQSAVVELDLARLSAQGFLNPNLDRLNLRLKIFVP